MLFYQKMPYFPPYLRTVYYQKATNSLQNSKIPTDNTMSLDKISN